MTAVPVGSPLGPKLGLNPLPRDGRDLKLRDYARLPRTPSTFGHESVVANWGMLGNDEWGDCVLAGGGHEHMLWNAVAGRQVAFTTQNALSDYGAITGFDPSKGPPGRNATDQGTDMRAAAKYRQQTGLVDAAGQRHKIAAYLFLNPGDPAELRLGMYLFEAVGVGVVLQEAQMQQFNAGAPWQPVKGSPDVGGHYFTGVQRRGRLTFDGVTWARLEAFTQAFYKSRSDQAVVYVTEDALNATSGKTAEGLDLAQLRDDLTQLGTLTPA